MHAGRIQQLAAEHHEELQRYMDDMDSAQGRLNTRLQVGLACMSSYNAQLIVVSLSRAYYRR